MHYMHNNEMRHLCDFETVQMIITQALVFGSNKSETGAFVCLYVFTDAFLHSSVVISHPVAFQWFPTSLTSDL